MTGTEPFIRAMKLYPQWVYGVLLVAGASAGAVAGAVAGTVAGAVAGAGAVTGAIAGAGAVSTTKRSLLASQNLVPIP